LTRAEGRRFGVTVGVAFIVFAALAAWRGHTTASVALAVLGVGLTLSGLLVPTRLGAIERGWMRMAHAISKVTTPVVMAIMFLMVITPIGLLRRAFGGNPLVHEPQGTSFWRHRPADATRSRSLTRQF
jgi:hypothetical protein